MTCCGCLGSADSYQEQAPRAVVNPILRTYLAANNYGTCRRYFLELLLVLGLFLPWMGPLLGLAVLDPIITVTLEQSKLLTPTTKCYQAEPAVCDATSYFDYYFWNITNAQQWTQGQPPVFQELGPYTFLVSENRFNVNFTDEYGQVEFSNYNFQQFVPEQSCPACTLNDTFVGINRAYQAVLQTTGGYETPILVSSVPLVLDGLLNGFSAAIQQAILGPMGGPTAGGLVVARSVHDWLYGEPPRDTQLLAVIQAKQQGGATVVTTAADVPLPVHNITIHGSNGGLVFGIKVKINTTETVLDGTWLRPVNTSYTGKRVDVKGISTMEFGLAPEAYAACNSSQPQAGDRCAYPDVYQGSWNASLTYACPTLLTLAHFYMADGLLANSTGTNFSPEPAQHRWTFGIEPVTGFALTGHKTYQINHRVRLTEVFYPKLWMNPQSPDGMWVPSFWVRSRFQPSDKDAASLRSVLQMKSLVVLLLVYVAPGVSAVLLLPAIYFLFLTKKARASRASQALVRKSRARNFHLSPTENSHIVALIEDMAPPDDEKNETAPLSETPGVTWQPSELDTIPAQHSNGQAERMQDKKGKAASADSQST
ncbi:hypothetical protein WJX72_005728 [[Myrmecia] bisecta]|uniref:Uncharacterized protein n=1 Tax=[Myrmecia] bisecta TaxID=41462 RepID=A0AAW1Q267_9CHLO